jgi:hypothetical protein
LSPNNPARPDFQRNSFGKLLQEPKQEWNLSLGQWMLSAAFTARTPLPVKSARKGLFRLKTGIFNVFGGKTTAFQAACSLNFTQKLNACMPWKYHAIKGLEFLWKTVINYGSRSTEFCSIILNDMRQFKRISDESNSKIMVSNHLSNCNSLHLSAPPITFSNYQIITFSNPHIIT